ncbi:MAG: transcriptional regulator [Desulfurococcaceae archaeon]|nr:transcriptional regulator [Desulfurococcaceae archaeon]
MSESEIVIDLSNIPLKPIGKREIQQLEMALIIGTLYRPEILDLIRDPVERSTWIDSLAVAAAAFARYKAGVPVSEIAEELGRSEVTIRGHLNQKTKAGKLVAETYEKIKRGELKVIVPFITATPQVIAPEAEKTRLEIEKLKEEKRILEERNRVLEEELEKTRSRLNELTSQIKRIRELIAELANIANKLLE